MFNLEDNYEIISHKGIRVVNNILDTTIKPSLIHGDGLFIDKFIKSDTTLTYLTEQILPNNLVKDFETPTREWNAIHKDFFLYRIIRTKYSFINHSRDRYNCEIKFSYPTVSLLSVKDIDKDEELLLDYRKEFLPKWYLEGHGTTYL